jgi:hypothetical protein
MKDYFLAAALGNGKLHRVIPLVQKVKGGHIAFHFFLIALALNFPVMWAISRLAPWEFYSRLYADNFAAVLGDLSPYSLIDESMIEDFNLTMYGNGFGVRTMLPMLAFVFFLILILQIFFYIMAAFFLGLSRMTASALSFRDRFAVLILSSTLPAIAAALFGLWMPTVHFIVFYLTEIILVFAISRAYDAEQVFPESEYSRNQNP